MQPSLLASSESDWVSGVLCVVGGVSGTSNPDWSSEKSYGRWKAFDFKIVRMFNFFIPEWQHSKECMCRLKNILTSEYQESVTSGQMDTQSDEGLTDRLTSDKVIPMCCCASQYIMFCLSGSRSYSWVIMYVTEILSDFPLNPGDGVYNLTTLFSVLMALTTFM